MAKTTNFHQREQDPIEFFLDCRDNGLLTSLCGYLDPLSLHSWGRALLPATRQKNNRESLLEDIGDALLRRTWLYSEGFSLVRAEEIFQDPNQELDENRDEEINGSCSRETPKPRPNADWKRKRELLSNSDYYTIGLERDPLLRPMLTSCFEGGLSEELNNAEMSCLCRFLAMTTAAAWKGSQYQFRVGGFAEHLALVALESVVEGLNLMNIKVSCPLEASHTLNLVAEATHSEYSKKLLPSTTVVGTLSELAWFPGTILEPKPLDDRVRRYCDFHPRIEDVFDMDERLTHEQQVAQVKHSIELLLLKSEEEEPDLEDFKEEIMEDMKRRLSLEREKPPITVSHEEEQSWEQLVGALGLTEAAIHDMMMEKRDARRSALKSFVSKTLPTLKPDKSWTNPLSVQGDRAKFSEAVHKFWTYWNPFTRSALNLVQFVVEDFAEGKTVRPFLVKHPKLQKPVRCHMLLGAHGTTMTALDKLEDGTRWEMASGKGYGRNRFGF